MKPWLWLLYPPSGEIMVLAEAKAADLNTTLAMTSTVDQETDALDSIDPIWTTSRTARQIYALGEVEKVRETIGVTEKYHKNNQSLRRTSLGCYLSQPHPSLCLLCLKLMVQTTNFPRERSDQNSSCSKSANILNV